MPYTHTPTHAHTHTHPVLATTRPLGWKATLLTRPTCPDMRARGPTMGGAVEEAPVSPPSELAAEDPRFHSNTAPSADPDTRSTWVQSCVAVEGWWKGGGGGDGGGVSEGGGGEEALGEHHCYVEKNSCTGTGKNKCV